MGSRKKATDRRSRAGTTTRAALWHLRKDGSKVFIQGVVRSLGRLGFAKIGQDITERRASETALRESEERLRQFGEASQNVLWLRDARTLQWSYLTPAFETIYGLSREEVLAGDNYRSWLELIVPEDRPIAEDAVRRVRLGERVTFDCRIRRPVDGRRVAFVSPNRHWGDYRPCRSSR